MDSNIASCEKESHSHKRNCQTNLNGPRTPENKIHSDERNQTRNCDYHQREEQGYGLDGLEHPEHDEAADLRQGEEVHPLHGHVAQELQVSLVLHGTQDQQDSLYKLKREDKQGRRGCVALYTCNLGLRGVGVWCRPP